MKHLCKLLLLALSLLCLPSLQAQLEVSLTSDRSELILGESIMLKIRISNSTDEPITLRNTPGHYWLHLRTSFATSSNIISPIARARFPKITIPAGQSSSFEFDLKPFYNLYRDSKYKVIATIRMPDQHTTYSSNSCMFNLSSGASIKEFTIKHNGKRLIIRARSLQTKGKNCIFGQVINKDSNKIVGASFLGQFLNFANPIFLLDKSQNLHMLCQSTPKYFSYAILSPAGNRIKYQVYQRTQGQLDLIPHAGKINVIGAIPYHEPKKGENYRSASERPF